MVGQILGIGALLMRIWSVVRAAKLLSFIFMKGLLLSLSLFILPRVIAVGILKFKEVLLPIFIEQIQPYLESVTGQSITLELSGFGAWVAQKMDLLSTFSLLLSGCFMFLAIRLIVGKS